MTTPPAAVTAEQLARKLAALPESAMREAALCAFLEGSDAHQAAAALDQLRFRGAEGGPPFSVALLALVRLLNNGRLPYQVMAELYHASKDDGLVDVGYLLLSNTSVATGALRAPAAGEQEQTLGHRKTIARTGKRESFMRLLRQPEAPVIEQLLLNPRLTERDVLYIASRRPADPQTQQAILASERWGRRYAVRRALVLNPSTPTVMSVRLLALLVKADVQLVAQSLSLPEVLRQAATQLVQRRRSI